MTTQTKKINELEVGDIVIFPYCKGVLIISKVEKLKDWGYMVYCVGIREPSRYQEYVEVTYLGKEEESMTNSSEQTKTTKKAKDLCIGDRVIFPGVGEITVTQLTSTNQEFVIQVGWSTGSDGIRTEAELIVLD